MDYDVFVSGDKVMVPGFIDAPMSREDALRLANKITNAVSPEKSTWRRWASKEDAELRRLYEDGETASAIARRLVRPVQSVQKRISRLGLSTRRPDLAARMRARHAAAKAAAE